jgi:hypothetical protein
VIALARLPTGRTQPANTRSPISSRAVADGGAGVGPQWPALSAALLYPGSLSCQLQFLQLRGTETRPDFLIECRGFSVVAWRNAASAFGRNCPASTSSEYFSIHALRWLSRVAKERRITSQSRATVSLYQLLQLRKTFRDSLPRGRGEVAMPIGRFGIGDTDDFRN